MGICARYDWVPKRAVNVPPIQHKQCGISLLPWLSEPWAQCGFIKMA